MFLWKRAFFRISLREALLRLFKEKNLFRVYGLLREKRFFGFTFRHVIQMFDDSPQGISVRGNNEFFSFFYLRHNYVVPIGERSFDRQLQRLAVWNVVSDVCVQRILKKK